MSRDNWILTNIYAPCTPEGKREFLEWFDNIQMPDEINWIIVGDFNLIRTQANRNRTGGNIQEMFAFNEAISKLRLVELPLKGCKFTWTNKQHPPLLERLIKELNLKKVLSISDCFFFNRMDFILFLEQTVKYSPIPSYFNSLYSIWNKRRRKAFHDPRRALPVGPRAIPTPLPQVSPEIPLITRLA